MNASAYGKARICRAAGCQECCGCILHSGWYSHCKTMPTFHSQAFRIIKALCLLAYKEPFPNEGAIPACSRAKPVLFNIFISCIQMKQNQLPTPCRGFWVGGCIFVCFALHSKRMSVPLRTKFSINSVVPNRSSNKLCKKKTSESACVQGCHCRNINSR